MSELSCPVVTAKICPHNNANALEIAQIFGFSCVVAKGQYRSGDMAVYIPEAAIVPDDVLDQIGLRGKLAGPDGNRVKAIKLRGALSQGLLYPAPDGLVTLPNGATRRFALGDNVAEFLGIKKYEPEVPFGMAGELVSLGRENLVAYDIENIQRYPDVFKEGEPVFVTEKIHGTFCGIGIMPFERDELLHKRIAVFSKKAGAQGLAFKANEANKNNLYLRMAQQSQVDRFLLEHFANSPVPVFVMGEIFGKGIQDLQYGLIAPSFRVFDFAIESPNEIKYVRTLGPGLSGAALSRTANANMNFPVPTVPLLYEGPFARDFIKTLVSGRETVSGGSHLREGVVIRPAEERYDPAIGRVILKWVSEEYLSRNNGTEYN